MSSNPINSQNMKLEVVVIPVSDVDRSKDFYKCWDGDWMPTLSLDDGWLLTKSQRGFLVVCGTRREQAT